MIPRSSLTFPRLGIARPRRGRSRLGLAFAFIGFALSAVALDWPQFRGPNGDGTTSERIRTNWAQVPPTLLWKTTAAGGFSSVAVSQNRVLTQVRRTVGGQSQEVCIALDAATGKELWARPLGTAAYDSGGGEGDGPRSTPTIHGDRVFVLSSYLVLACLDLADGHQLWSVDLRSVYGGSVITWQSSASPLIENDLVIVNCNAANKTLLALRVTDGTKVWQTSANDRMTHSTPIATTLLGMRQVIFYAQSGLVAVNPTNGTVLWRQSFKYNGTSAAASPVVAGNLVYASAAYNTGALVARVTKPGTSFTAAIAAQKPFEVQSHWVTPVAFGNYVFGCYGQYQDTGTDAPFECYRMDTLEQQWSEPGFGHAGAIVVRDQLLALTETGDLVLVAPDPTAYRELARFNAVTGKCWNVPAVSNGRIYVRSIKQIAAYDVAPPPPPTLRLQPELLADGTRIELRVSDPGGAAIDASRTNGISLWRTADPTVPNPIWAPVNGNWISDGGLLRLELPRDAGQNGFFRTQEVP